MKKTLLLALLFLISYSSFGQKIRFSDSTNRWHYYLWGDATIPPISIPLIDYYLDDTIIHSLVYRTLKHGYGTNVFIREDSVTQKVYAIWTTPPGNDTTEQLLYDYNLTIGDTFNTTLIKYKVTAKDSVIINLLTYHTWRMHPFFVDSSILVPGNFTNDIVVIEGIGSINDPCFPLAPFSFEAITNLNCFSNRGTTPPLSDTVGRYFNNTTSCTSTFGLGTNNYISHSNKSIVLPNPITESSIIQLPYSITSGTLTITNTLGQDIIQSQFQNKQELLIGHLIKSPGIYFYRVSDNSNGELFSGKFVY